MPRRALLLVIAACGGHDASPPPPRVADAAPAPAPPDAMPTLAILRAAEPKVEREVQDEAALTSRSYIARIWGPSGCPDTGVFTLAQGCERMTQAVIRTWGGRAWIVIGNPRCEETGQPWVDTQDVVAVVLPAGPGARFFAGHPIGTHAQVELADGRFSLTQLNDVALVVEPVSLEAGRHVHGALAIDGYGEGPFDAVVCPDQAPIVDALPDVAPPDTPLAGLLDGEPFDGEVQIARVTVEEHTTFVELGVADRDLPCDDVDRWEWRGLFLGGGGIAAPFPFRGTAQPMIVRHGGDERFASGWVVWDDLPTAPGAVIRGHAVIASPADTPADSRTYLAGTIAATICPR